MVDLVDLVISTKYLRTYVFTFVHTSRSVHTLPYDLYTLLVLYILNITHDLYILYILYRTIPRQPIVPIIVLFCSGMPEFSWVRADLIALYVFASHKSAQLLLNMNTCGLLSRDAYVLVEQDYM